MKIIELKAENIKKLKVVEIKPVGSTVIISGKNEQGKSSVLDSIWYTLGGAEAMKDTHKPIREGETSAIVRLDLGEIIVTRKWTADDKSYLTVENKDGATFKSPQAILDKLIGNLSFDPLAFSHMDAKKQKEILLGLVKIDLDLSAWEVDRKTKYDERAVINRRIREIEGHLAEMPPIPEGTPDEEMNFASIMSEVREAQKIKEENENKRHSLYILQQELAQKEEKIRHVNMEMRGIHEQRQLLHDRLKKLHDDVNSMGKEYAVKCEEINEMEKHISTLVEPDMIVFEARIDEASGINEAVRAKKEWEKVRDLRNEAKKSSELLTSQLDNLDETKDMAIKAAKFPIDGLAFNDTGVTYKGIPFSQCSTAERLRVSLAMAMSMNPKLRVLRIMDGSLLDSKNMQVIQEMVAANDYQCWIEKVDETGKVGVYIEDGEVKA